MNAAKVPDDARLDHIPLGRRGDINGDIGRGEMLPSRCCCAVYMGLVKLTPVAVLGAMGK